MGRMRILLKIPSKLLSQVFTSFSHIVLKHSLISIAVYIQKKQKDTKRTTLQVKALENARKAPRNFLELLHEIWMETPSMYYCMNSWSKYSTDENWQTWKLCPRIFHHIWGQQPPSSTCRGHFCIVCEFISNYTCAKCGMCFCSIWCQKIHDDTPCLKFFASLLRPDWGFFL